MKSSVLIICERGHYFICTLIHTDQLASSAVKALIVGEDVLLKQLYNESIKFCWICVALNGMVCL